MPEFLLWVLLPIPPAYRTVQNRLPIISTTCLFNIFLALAVITILLLIAAITGLAFEVHETWKKCFSAVNAKVLTKETVWVEFAIPMYLFGFLVSTTTNTLPKKNFYSLLFLPSVHTSNPNRFSARAFLFTASIEYSLSARKNSLPSTQWDAPTRSIFPKHESPKPH